MQVRAVRASAFCLGLRDLLCNNPSIHYMPKPALALGDVEAGTAPAHEMLQPGGRPRSECGGHWGYSQMSQASLLLGRWQAYIAAPTGSEVAMLWLCRTRPERGLRGKEKGVSGRGGSESMGCSAGADPPRKGSERAGQGQGCRLGPWGWLLRPEPGQQVAINQFPSLSLQHRCSALVLSDVQEEGLGQGVTCGKSRVLGLRVCRPAQGAWRAACLGLYLPWSTGTRCPLLHALQAEDPVLAFMGANLEKLAI